MIFYSHKRWGLLLGGAVAYMASANLPAAPTNAPPSTNAPPVGTNGIPLSVFEVNLPGGKDPFFSRSSRNSAEGYSAPEDKAATILALQGISGPANRRLAIINNHTFAAGEDGEIVTAVGRIRVRCEEIKNDVAVVCVGSSTQRIELRLPSRF
jgi:hypothetical protein